MQTDEGSERPREIKWAPCNCGSPSCRRQHPTNLGTFYQGNGFEPHEAAWIDAAWAALNEADDRKERP